MFTIHIELHYPHGLRPMVKYASAPHLPSDHHTPATPLLCRMAALAAVWRSGSRDSRVSPGFVRLLVVMTVLMHGPTTDTLHTPHTRAWRVLASFLHAGTDTYPRIRPSYPTLEAADFECGHTHLR